MAPRRPGPPVFRFMREQKPEVRTALIKERKLKTNAQGQPDDERLNAAIEFFQMQFVPPKTGAK